MWFGGGLDRHGSFPDADQTSTWEHRRPAMPETVTADFTPHHCHPATPPDAPRQRRPARRLPRRRANHLATPLRPGPRLTALHPAPLAAPPAHPRRPPRGGRLLRVGRRRGLPAPPAGGRPPGLHPAGALRTPLAVPVPAPGP